jgi:hypothetical protein
LADENPDDVVARIYAERATAYVVNPPGPDWTGGETFETK